MSEQISPFKPFDNLRFLGIVTPQEDSGGAEEVDQFAFMDDSAIASRADAKKAEEAAWEASEQQELQRWLEKEAEESAPSAVDTMSSTEFEKQFANLKKEEKARRCPRSGARRLETPGRGNSRPSQGAAHGQGFGVST